MVLANGDINIIADMEGTTGVKLHNNRQKLRARFDIVRKLGQGTYGKVQLAINKDTGEEVAIKTIKKSKIETEQDLVRIQREIQIMSSVQHAHIIHIYEVFENREKIVLVMEYANGGELYDYLSFKKVLTEAEARRVFRQVVAAVYYCHKNMICHRDLKLENILLDERGNAKIADFGLSNIFDERSFLHTFCGSPLYASPEIVKGTPYFGPEVDCWSLGVLLYTLVYGAMPFDGSNFKRLVKQISEGDYYEPKVPSEASGLIRHMLTVEPSKRATVDDICCHVWVNVDEELPLMDVSQEMCRQMPVRLDYLLALSAAAAGAGADALPSPPPPADGTEKAAAAGDDALPAPPTAAEIAPEEEDDASQWERPALQALASENEQNGTATAKKHKMAPSTSSVLPNSSSHKVVHKKRKEDEKKSGGDPPDSDDKGGGAEKIVQAESRPQEAATASSDTEMKSVEDDKKAGSVAETTSAQTASIKDNKGKEGSEIKKEEEGGATETETTKDEVKSVTSTTDKTATNLKKKTSFSRKSTTAADAPVAAPATKPENSTAENGTTKPVNRVSKFRKSVSVSKDGKDASGSTSPSTPPTEGGTPVAATTQTPPTPPPAAPGTEKRKASLSSWSRIADARKAFERRSPEKKPAFPQGSKVNSVRRSFESPPSTPESGSPSVKGIARPFGSSVERKGSMTNSASASTVAKKVDEKKNGTTTTSAAPTTETTPSSPQEPDQDKKNMGAPLSKQPSKTNARTGSPTKGVRTNDKSADSGLHHRGCVPSEARAAAAAAQEAKKVSPPKSLVRKNSLSKTAPSGGFSKSPSKEMKASTTPPVGRPTPTVRPRSPTKAMKSAAPNQTGKVAPSTSATKVSPDTKMTTEPTAEDNVTTTMPETSENTESTAPTGELEVPSREKRGSIEIAPLPSSALVRRYPETDQDDGEMGGPQLRFVPRNKGGFTLLGVKSEVVFDVDSDGTQLAIEDVSANKEMAANPPKIIKGKSETSNAQVVSRQAETREAASTSESDSKIIRYIATVRKHGSSGECGEVAGPERVTLLKLRCSSSHDGFSDETKSIDSPGTPDTTSREQIKTVGTKSPSIKISMKLGEHQTQVEVNSGAEQRGYNVYRSKYHSVQKYRSIIERRDGEESTEHEEVREVQQTAEAAATATPLVKEKPAAVERSDSFSSTGSNDDLEDVFESLTSESLFTSLLSRTRNLMHRLSDGGGGDNSSHARFLRSDMMRRPPAMSSILSSVSGRSGFQLPSPLGSFAINSPTLSFRMNVAPRSSYATEHPTTYRNNSSTSSLRSAGGDYRPTEEGADTAESRSARRFRYSRSTTRSGGEEDEEDASTSRIRSTNASVTSSRVSFSNYAGSRSTSVNSQLSSSESREQQRQSRYDAAHRNVVDASVHERDGARSDIISALMRHRNRSLDNRDRPQSYYEGSSTPSSRDWTPTSSFSSMRSPSSAYAQQQQQQQQSSVQSSSRPRGFQESSREEPAGLYGSRRAGGRYQRYSKSVTKELAEEYDSEEPGNLLRPRSLLVLSDLSADEAGSSAAVSPSEESTAAASSVSRDYSKSVSQEGSVRREEEQESEHKHSVTQLTNGTVTSTVRRETKRSVSQTEDGSDGTASTGSATPTGLPQRLLKKMSGDDLPRMDSGIGSLHDGGTSSGPATPTSAGVSSRRGILKFARSVSSELESLEEEINSIGGSGRGRAGRSSEAAGRSDPPPDGAAPDLSKRRTSGEGTTSDNGQGDNGSATPVSDSAETGSVCSDTASNDPGTYSQSRGSEEESVGERIRRKSFFARFNDTRTPRKSRKTSSTNLPSVAALRSELGRSSSLRHHIFDSDSPLGAGSSHRSYFDPTADFFSPPPLMRRCSGGNGNGGGGGGNAPHHQRWSMHFGSNNADGSSFDPNDYLYGGSGDLGVPPLPRRGSQTGQSSSYSGNSTRNNAQDGSWNGEDSEQPAGLNRTHSLPEEDCPPRPVFRQHSMPGSSNGSGNPASGDTEGAEGNSAPTTSATTNRRRPDRLNLYPTTSRGQSAISPSEDGSDMSDSGPGLPTGLSRRNMAGSPPGGRRSTSRPGRLDPLDAWDGVGSLHGRAGHSLASLMDSLESPSEVLQKAMDLCDSLRFS